MVLAFLCWFADDLINVWLTVKHFSSYQNSICSDTSQFRILNFSSLEMGNELLV